MEERIVAVEKDIEVLKENHSVLDKRITSHGKEIDALDRGMDSLRLDIELIKQSSKYTEENTREIKQTLKELSKMRHNDHFEIPLANNRKLMWIVISLIVAFIVGIILNNLFPGV